jgi:hypothetical protein
MRRKAQTGAMASAKQGQSVGGGQLARHIEVLIGWVNADGDITMPEFAAKLDERGVAAHPASLSQPRGCGDSGFLFGGRCDSHFGWNASY